MGIKDRTDEIGIDLVTIGSGSPEQAKEFIASFAFEGEMYVDPGLKTYKAFKLVRGLWRTLGPASIGRGLSAMKKGFRQGQNAGDLWQQGGMFVIGSDNQMFFEHRNSSAGDHADLNAVLKACQAM